jgi:hypothetical protein
VAHIAIIIRGRVMRFNLIKNYLKSIIKKYFSLKDKYHISPVFKLSHVKYCDSYGYDICVIQVIGKNAFTEMKAQYIIKDKRFLNGFAPEDIVQITRMSIAIENRLQMKALKLKEYINKKDAQDTIICQQIDTGTLHVLRMADVLPDEPLLNRFNSLDAFNLGYLKGVNDKIKEEVLIKKAKDKYRKLLFSQNRVYQVVPKSYTSID